MNFQAFFLCQMENAGLTILAVPVQILETQDKWFGVTYKEDKLAVVAVIRELVAAEGYPEKLF